MKPLLPGEDINDTKTWSIHIPSSADTPNICGDLTNPATDFHTYWSWKMGGQKYYYPAPDDKRGTEINGAAYIDSGSPPDLNAQSPDSGYGKPVSQTLPAEVLTMEQWMDAGSPIGDYWVIDTDGWAYWADAIRPATATGLLLDSETLVHKMQESYKYIVSVQAQMATKYNEDGTSADYVKFGTSGWTDNGHKLMELITQNDEPVVEAVNTDNLTSSLPILDGKIYVRQGSSVDLGLKGMAAVNSAIHIIPNQIGGARLTWQPERGVWNLSIDQTAKEYSSFTLALEEDGGNGSTASVNIAVIPEETNGVIMGRGSAPILDYGNGSYRPIWTDDNGVLYAGSWISGSDLGNTGFAIVSTLPIVNEVVYIKQGESLGLTVTGTAPDFKRIAGCFPCETADYSIV